MKRRPPKKKTTKKPVRRSVPGYSNFGGGGPFALMGSPVGLGYLPAGGDDESAIKKAKKAERAREKRAQKPKPLPTLAECEKALGEKAETWVARCYEISYRIVAAGLVDGEAVYGHWLGDVAPRSHFADRGHRLAFIPHGWILLKDGRVLDPTRWVFEDVAPYLYIGEEPDHWSVTPCANCKLLKEEHRDDGPEDQCEMFEVEKWPYDEGGNQWRDAVNHGRPAPVPEGPRAKTGIHGWTDTWVASLLGEKSAAELTVNQLFYLANLSYMTMKQGVGPEGVKMIYNAICDHHETAISFIPVDNANRARRECGFDRV